MVSSETWMGSGTYVTLAPESELFLGYMPLGPTLGMANTNKAHLIKYSVGHALDGTAVTVGTTALFSDYYELVPDLYTGCIAKFYYTDDNTTPANGAAHSLRFTAVVAGNDASAIYFSGNISEFPTLYNKVDATSANPRGYIILESQGTPIPAPLAYEVIDGAVTAMTTQDIKIASITATNTNKYVQGDIIRNASGVEIGRVYAGGGDAGALVIAHADPTSTDTELHLISEALTAIDGTPLEASTSISTVTLDAHVVGKLSAGDWVSTHASDPDNAACHTMGRVMTNDETAKTVKIALKAAADKGVNNEEIYWGETLRSSANTLVAVSRVKPRILSDNWLGIANSVTPSNVEIETKQVNMALGGSRNFSFQYRGMETAGAAGLDLNLNHGSWLFYALGSLTSASCLATDTTDVGANRFITGASAYTNVSSDIDVAYSASNSSVWVGYDNTDSDAGAQNGKFHRVPNGTSTLCPPILPGNGASPLTNDPSVSNGIASNLITYTFDERNDSILPSLALELSNQKGSALSSEPMVDRNTYNQTAYAQIYPGCVVNSLSLTANENEEVKATLDFNVKRVFECPDGYVARMYDATNNDTNEFKNLFNFGNITNNNEHIVQEFIDPFFFSDGTISLFGQEFLKVQSMSMSITNNVQDKRYFGQYNKQIKMSVPTQRNYEVSISAQVTDRRIFDELRRQSPHRFALGVDAVGSNSRIQLLFTKTNGESFKLQFDDYLISASTWPIPDDRGPIYVDFTIMPIRVNVMNAVSSWVMQS